MPGEPIPMNIALWGYGRYGKNMLRSIQAHWGGRYRVVAVFDKSIDDDAECLLEGGIPLLNPSKALSEYERGTFEAVVASVVGINQVKEIEESALSLGIPATRLVARDELCPMESFERVSTLELPYGFELHEYKSLFGFHAPLYAYETFLFLFDELGQGLIDNWFVDTFWGDATAFNPAFPFDTDVAPVVNLPGEYCAVTRTWGMNYWHFTYQFLDQIALMEKNRFKGKYILPRAPFAEELMGLANIGEDRILWLDDFDSETIYHFETMFVLARDEYDYKQSAPAMVDAARIIESNAAKRKSDVESYPTRLFVRRIKTRRLLRAEDLLEAYGFQTIIPEDLTVTQQIQYFMNADIVLSPHGANSTNSLYMRPGSVFIETFGRGWVIPCCVETAYLKGIHYLPVVQTPISGTTIGSFSGDYKVNNSILEMAIKSAIQLVGQKGEA